MNSMPHDSEFAVDPPRLMQTRAGIKSWINDETARIVIENLSYASRGVMADSARSAWFALAVDAGHEIDVDNYVGKFDVETYLAMTKPLKRTRRGRVKIIPARPVMPSYVLVRCAHDDRAFMGLRGVEGVVGIVGGVARPWPIADRIIREFKAMIANGGADEADPDRLSAGDLVFVRKGPFADFQGVVESVAKGRDAVIIVDIFGHSNRIRMPLDYFEKL